MNEREPTHYEVLGVHRRCSQLEVRDAYRLLVKQHHPDVHRDSSDSELRIQSLNAAYEVLSDPPLRRRYDQQLDRASRSATVPRGGTIQRNIVQDLRLRIEDLLRGTSVDVQVNDPANPAGDETYRLQVPAGTAPNARFRLPRSAPMEGGHVQLRVKVLPGFRFKVRGADLRCELRIDARRAEQGGTETLQGASGTFLRLTIPPRVKRGEILRVPNEGMPKPRGGRGDLLVRITYRPEVRISRT